MANEFKTAKECLECTKHKKECKGYSFSLKIQSMFCPNKIAKKKK
jgi:hypothetical protein